MKSTREIKAGVLKLTIRNGLDEAQFIAGGETAVHNVTVEDCIFKCLYSAAAGGSPVFLFDAGKYRIHELRVESREWAETELRLLTE